MRWHPRFGASAGLRKDCSYGERVAFIHVAASHGADHIGGQTALVGAPLSAGRWNERLQQRNSRLNPDESFNDFNRFGDMSANPSTVTRTESVFGLPAYVRGVVNEYRT